jgi:hypothetical protein
VHPGDQLNRNVELRIASLLSLVLLTLHLADDAARGMFPGGIAVVYAAIAAGALLYGIVMQGDRRLGLVVMLIVSLFAVAMPVLHTNGAGVGTIAKSSGGLFFVWTLVALGALGTFTFILSVRALVGPASGEAGPR